MVAIIRRKFTKGNPDEYFQNISLGKKCTSSRLFAIDELRGFCLVCMILYHLCYDTTFIFGVDFPIFSSSTMDFIRDIVVCVFIVISGISRNLSSNNFISGIKVLFAATVVSIVLSYMDMPVYFGILHFISFAIFLSPLLKKLISKIPPTFFYPIIIGLFVVLKPIPDGYIGIKNLYRIVLPQSIYKTNWLFFLGFPRADFVSYDYVPVIPWILVFILGLYIGRNFRTSPPKWANASVSPFFGMLGRHSLGVYLLHQPIIMACLYIIDYL